MLTIQRFLYLTLFVISFLPSINPVYALCLGIAFSQLFSNPFAAQSSWLSQRLLKLSVMGLGFGLSINEVWQVGKSSIGLTFVAILSTIAVGVLIGRLLKIDPITSGLISCGTAICGGSAIAAMVPVLQAKNNQSAIALSTVFILNALALVTFPVIGHQFDLSQHQFGLWAGMAIHDTSSVVGAAASYGDEALHFATTVKLTRALWIAPLTLAAGLLFKSDKRPSMPLFIGGFILAAILRSQAPTLEPLWNNFSLIAKQCLAATLFLIGSGLSRQVLKQTGIRPLVQGTTLWIIVSGITLLFIQQQWIG